MVAVEVAVAAGVVVVAAAAEEAVRYPESGHLLRTRADSKCSLDRKQQCPDPQQPLVIMLTDEAHLLSLVDHIGPSRHQQETASYFRRIDIDVRSISFSFDLGGRSLHWMLIPPGGIT